MGNDDIAKFADGKTIRYLNINDKLADKDGQLLEGMSGDRLHLSLKGYQVWADALKPLFTELLGPPAREDHAPPPIGDPSAAKKKGLAHAHRRGVIHGDIRPRNVLVGPEGVVKLANFDLDTTGAAEIIARMCAPERADQYATVGDVMEDLSICEL